MNAVSQVNPVPGLDSKLLRKYNQPVPRYTSYPTALKFCVIDDAESREAMYKDWDHQRPLSLYFHLPFCKSLCWFCGCTKIISQKAASADTYLDYLEKEIAIVRPLLGENRKVVQLHFGGGSPNFLTPKQVDRLSALIHSNFEFEEKAECSVEIDPRILTKEKVDAFRRLGVNRASIGVQDVNPQVQIAIHRIQPSDTNKQAIRWLKEAGVTDFNVDLIYGLPCQTVESFSQTLEEVLKYDADRFAVFSYAHVPWSQPAQKLLENSPIPTPDEKMDMLKGALNRFLEAGYSHIGMDHFTKPNDALARAQRSKTLQRNFQGYSLHKDAQICGFGISAISQSRKRYRQNFKDLETYFQYLDEGKCPIERGYVMSKEDLKRRTVIMRLMCDLELDFEQLSKELGFNFKTHFQKELQQLRPLKEDGLVTLSEKSLTVTNLGKLLIRNIATVFDAYYGEQETGFSKAV